MINGVPFVFLNEEEKQNFSNNYQLIFIEFLIHARSNQVKNLVMENVQHFLMVKSLGNMSQVIYTYITFIYYIYYLYVYIGNICNIRTVNQEMKLEWL